MVRTGEPYRLFAITAPGLAPLAAAELEALGVAGVVVSDDAGVEWSGTLEQLYAANLHLRTASRIVLRLRTFTARAFWELEKQARRVPWETVVAPGAAVAFRVTSRKSKLYHEAAIAERLAEAVTRAVPSVTVVSGSAPTDDDGVAEERSGPGMRDDADDGAMRASRPGLTETANADDDEPQLFIVRVHRDRFTLSADTSGALLHRRGYRQATAKAPLRETLAAAMLLAGGWDRRSPLVDPFCGSGTIPIEAALLARRIPPGLSGPDHAPRRYAFRRWPDFDAALWDDVVTRARDAILPAAPGPILGTDRNGGAIRAARSNAGRAGVEGDVAFDTRTLSAVEPPPGPGWIVTNPPYGVRIGERRRLFDLYAALGRIARERFGGWSIALLSANPALEARTGLELEEVLRTRNGGIGVRVVVARTVG